MGRNNILAGTESQGRACSLSAHKTEERGVGLLSPSEFLPQFIEPPCKVALRTKLLLKAAQDLRLGRCARGWFFLAEPPTPCRRQLYPGAHEGPLLPPCPTSLSWASCCRPLLARVHPSSLLSHRDPSVWADGLSSLVHP